MVPDGSRPTDTDIYVRSGQGTGFSGTWRKVRSREAPTTWRISVHEGRMILATTDGAVNTSFSLNEANTPQGVYVSLGLERGNRYTVVGPLKFLEEELRQGRFVAQGTGTLSPNGQTMTEDHTDSGPEANPIHIVYDRISSSPLHKSAETPLTSLSVLDQALWRLWSKLPLLRHSRISSSGMCPFNDGNAYLGCKQRLPRCG